VEASAFRTMRMDQQSFGTPTCATGAPHWSPPSTLSLAGSHQLPEPWAAIEDAVLETRRTRTRAPSRQGTETRASRSATVATRGTPVIVAVLSLQDAPRGMAAYGINLRNLRWALVRRAVDAELFATCVGLLFLAPLPAAQSRRKAE
jgi:hypothetical protein